MGWLDAYIAPAQASVVGYDFSVKITASYEPVFFGQTYTGSFSADTATGAVTNFTSNLLGGTFNSADLGTVASFDALGNVTKLTFQSAVATAFGSQNFGFTTGFTNTQITVDFNLDLNNYFAFLDPQFGTQGGGTPVFTTRAAAEIPEPGSLALLGLGIAVLVALRKRNPR